MLPVFPGGIVTAPLVASASGVTNASGLVTLALQVPMNLPGTLVYGGLNPASTGRFMMSAHLFFNNPQPGDQILAAYVADQAGIMPSDDQALFPGYPLLASLIDPIVPTGNQFIPIDPKKGSVDVVSNGQVFIPSGIYVVVTAQAAGNRSDTFNGSLVWLCQVPQV